MGARIFDSDEPLDQRRIIIRRYGGCLNCRGVSNPRNRAGYLSRSYARRADRSRVIAAWCRRPNSGIAGQGKNYNFRLANGDWFYLAGIWRPATRDWPEGNAILTIQANDDIAPYHDRQMAVLRRDERSASLDMTQPEHEVLRSLSREKFRDFASPPGSQTG